MKAISYLEQARQARIRGDKFFNSICDKHGKVLRHSRESDAGQCTICSAESKTSYGEKENTNLAKAKIALEAGKKTFEGTMCKHHNTRIKYANSRMCIECKNERNKSRKKGVHDMKRAFKSRYIVNCIFYGI